MDTKLNQLIKAFGDAAFNCGQYDNAWWPSQCKTVKEVHEYHSEQYEKLSDIYDETEKELISYIDALQSKDDQ